MTSSVAPSGWTPAQLPDLSGLVAVVTGANSGLGFETALGLAQHGAHVVLGCRDQARGQEAMARLRERSGAWDGAVSAELRTLDLADLASVRGFASEVLTAHGSVAVLVNNAGVMALPPRRTADGFELQLGTNHLGHFALTGLLLPGLLAAGRAGVTALGGQSRVVTVSSVLHRFGRISRDDLMSERSYKRFPAYFQSKVANLLFMRELHRRLTEADAPVASLGAHPGFSDTNLQTTGPRMAGNALDERFNRMANALFAQPAERGAWPSLRAAGDPAARSGEFYGPGGPAELRGHPRTVGMSAAARDDDTALWLWDRSVALTGVAFGELQ